MNKAWSIVIISIATDFIINAGSSLMAAMTATQTTAFPNKVAITVILIGGLVQAARTLQSALKTMLGLNPDLGGKPQP